MTERESHKQQIRNEMRQVSEHADALARILPGISDLDPETKRKVEQEIESCRLRASWLSEHIRDRD